MKLKEAQKICRDNNCYDFPTPWIIDTAKRIPKDAHWSDNAAWESWMENRLHNYECHQSLTGQYSSAFGCRCPSCQTIEWWENIEITEKATLYALMSDACRITAEDFGWKPVPTDKQGE